MSSPQFIGRTPDRYETGFGGMTVAVYSPLGTPRPRDECQPFTFEFHATRDTQDVKAQEKFVKGLAALEKKIAREHKARARALKAAA